MVKDEKFPLQIDGVTTTATPSDFKRFARTYDRLGDEGWCDGFGGAESQRVWVQWLDCGKPRELSLFIRDLANAPVYIDPNINEDTPEDELPEPWGSALAKWLAEAQR